MFSESAIESAIYSIVAEIKKELETNKEKPDVCVVLKKLGRFALNQIDWGAPSWVHEYDVLLKE